jgi:hypothetical protein
VSNDTNNDLQAYDVDGIDDDNDDDDDDDNDDDDKFVFDQSKRGYLHWCV